MQYRTEDGFITSNRLDGFCGTGMPNCPRAQATVYPGEKENVFINGAL